MKVLEHLKGFNVSRVTGRRGLKGRIVPMPLLMISSLDEKGDEIVRHTVDIRDIDMETGLREAREWIDQQPQ
jgi:hypothetical protein